MKTTYVEPKVEMISWNIHDVITTSGGVEQTTRNEIPLPEI